MSSKLLERSLKEHLAEQPVPKNPAAVSLGRLGGLKGGNARAVALSPSKRPDIAKKAAAKRWKEEEPKILVFSIIGLKASAVLRIGFAMRYGTRVDRNDLHHLAN